MCILIINTNICNYIAIIFWFGTPWVELLNYVYKWQWVNSHERKKNWHMTLCNKMSVYDPKVTFVEPLMGFRHIGHFFSAGAHCAPLTKWPHGKKTIETFSSQQILHICASFINSFSFFTSSGMEKNHNFYNKWIATITSTLTSGRIIFKQ